MIRHTLLPALAAAVLTATSSAAEDAFAPTYERIIAHAEAADAGVRTRLGALALADANAGDAVSPANAIVSAAQEFAVIAADASARLRLDGGPDDLACIYAGMAEDVEVRLGALRNASTQAAQAEALEALSALYVDAYELTPRPERPAAANMADLPPFTCSASIERTGPQLSYFTEQP